MVRNLYARKLLREENRSRGVELDGDGDDEKERGKDAQADECAGEIDGPLHDQPQRVRWARVDGQHRLPFDLVRDCPCPVQRGHVGHDAHGDPLLLAERHQLPDQQLRGVQRQRDKDLIDRPLLEQGCNPLHHRDVGVRRRAIAVTGFDDLDDLIAEVLAAGELRRQLEADVSRPDDDDVGEVAAIAADPSTHGAQHPPLQADGDERYARKGEEERRGDVLEVEQLRQQGEWRNRDEDGAAEIAQLTRRGGQTVGPIEAAAVQHHVPQPEIRSYKEHVLQLDPHLQHPQPAARIRCGRGHGDDEARGDRGQVG
jgi:DNA-binding transcriptional regulator YbjK